MFIADKVLRKVLYLRRTKMESKKKKKKKKSGVPRAFVVRRSSVRSVARGDDDTDSLFTVSTLTSGVSVTWAIVGSRMARRQTSKSGNM